MATQAAAAASFKGNLKVQWWLLPSISIFLIGFSQTTLDYCQPVSDSHI